MEVKINKIHTQHELVKLLKPMNYVRVLFNPRGMMNHIIEGVFVRLFDNSSDKPRIFLINNALSDIRISSVHRNQEERTYLEDLIEKLGYCSFSNVSGNQNYFGEVLTFCYVLDDKFDEGYSSCVKSNPKILNPVISKFGVDYQNFTIMKLIYLLSYGSANYMAWGVKNFVNRNVGLHTLINIFTWVNKYGTLTNKLSKGTITAYNTYRDINNMVNEMQSIRRDKRINDAINMFNTAQKKMLKGADIQKDGKDALAKMKRLNPVIQKNFVRKMSTIEDCGELFSHLHHLVNTHFKWNKESFIDFVTHGEGMSCRIVVDKENIVIVQVDNFETIKKIGKNANWCISKNRAYWENYINKGNQAYTKQYVMCDFSKSETNVLSMIGFTITNSHISAAHNFVNDNMLSEKPYFLEDKKSFIYLCNGIYSILNDNNISIEDIIGNKHSEAILKCENKTLRPIVTKWDKQEVIDFFFEQKKDDARTLVIKNEGDTLILLTKSCVSDKFFYGKFICDESYCMMFFDFSKKYEEEGALSMCLIRSENNLDDSNIAGSYNQYFERINFKIINKVLDEGLPLSVIPSFSNERKVLKFIINEGRFDVLSELLNDDKYRYALRQINDELMYYITSQIFDYGNFDLLRLLYEKGIKLTNFCNIDEFRSFMSRLTNIILSNRASRKVLIENEKFEDLLNYNYAKNEDSNMVRVKGFMTVFYMIMENEGLNKDIYSQCVRNLFMIQCPFAETLAICIAKTININKPSDNFKRLIQYAIRCNRRFVYDIICERNISNKKLLQQIINQLRSEGGDMETLSRFQDLYKTKYPNDKFGEESEIECSQDIFVQANENSLIEAMEELISARRSAIRNR